MLRKIRFILRQCCLILVYTSLDVRRIRERSIAVGEIVTEISYNKEAVIEESNRYYVIMSERRMASRKLGEVIPRGGHHPQHSEINAKRKRYHFNFSSFRFSRPIKIFL